MFSRVFRVAAQQGAKNFSTSNQVSRSSDVNSDIKFIALMIRRKKMIAQPNKN